MLVTHRVIEALAKARAFAASVGLTENLEKNLAFLANYIDSKRTRCTLYPDHAPYSFSFLMELQTEHGFWQPMFEGGLIYHGPLDAYGSGTYPTLAVTIQPVNGWTIHT